MNSLMPLLVQIQLRSRDPGLQAGLAPGGVPTANAGPTVSPADLVAQLAPPNPEADHHAAANMAENLAADSLRTLSAYLETHVGQHHGLDRCVPVVIRAANCFAARDHAQALGLVWEAYRMIASLRMADLELPPPRASSLAEPRAPSAQPLSH
jgi:hypothetical protein